MVSMADISFSVMSVVEDVLRQHGTRLSDIDLASRKAEEASTRRYEATSWLRKIVGVVCSKDLPAEPSEEHFRLGLRSGIILCNAINRVQPGAVPKVVEAPNDTVVIPDGAALMAYQYFENVRNFLVAVEEMGLPTFEASDLEQGGKTARIVNCVLALKSFNEWKVAGGNGVFKFSGSTKTPSAAKGFARKNSEPFMNSISRTSSVSEKSLDTSGNEQFGDLALDFSDMTNSHSLNVMIRALLMDKKQEEIPNIVESMLSRVMEEFERRLASHPESVKYTPETMSVSGQNTSPTESPKAETQIDDDTATDKGSETGNESESENEIETQTETELVPEQVKTEQVPRQVKTEQASEQVKTEQVPEQVKTEQVPDQVKAKQVAEQVKAQQVAEQVKAEQVPDQVKAKQVAEQVKAQQVAEQVKAQQVAEQVKAQQAHALREEALKRRLKKQNMLFERQMNDIQGLKHTVNTTKKSMQFLQMKYREEFDTLGKHMYTLAHAASGYRKVLEENRRLYNQVQDLKGNIRVYCRVRPFLPGQANGLTTVDHIEDGNITIMNPNVKNTKEGKKIFNFNKVFGPYATQAEVYVDMQPLVRSCLDGYNVCIFAYGQTGAGKTYTMSGPNDVTEETYGVNYRALNDLFHLSEQRKATSLYEVSVQMMEIYNEQVRDLLAPDGANRRLEIRNSSQTGINVPDATRLPVTTTSDVINLMNIGFKNRAVSSTAMNDRSSRSHSCMTVHVQGKDITSGSMIRGCMHLVDLAGSERVDKSEVTGDRLKEAQHINKSLAALGDVIASLSSKNAHVPYRNSKLTQLLQDSLGGQAKTLMFVHISPEPDAVGETISTLKFAERVSTVELGAARTNKDNNSSDVKELKEQILTLKAALVRKDEEMEQIPRSISSTPESGSVKSTASSPMHPSYRPSKDTPSGRKSPVKDASNSKGYTLDDTLKDTQDSESLDELDMATSDSSEQDFQVNLPRVSSLPSLGTSLPSLGTKLKKPQVKPSKSPEKRSMIPVPPTRKVSNGTTPVVVKNGRQSVHVKRKTANVK
ncbi:kinesin-like protein KIN-14I isoform X2 [Silene latifolia]|uniref:kinesin-like protein KIN-14I isoform X2 n=1 Tax=Silene latifolia TaxID=37657 RepID=UPI003D772054